MPRVSAKRQVTLPVAQCREAGIGPGDEYRSYVADGRITIVRKTAHLPSREGCVRCARITIGNVFDWRQVE